MTLENEISSE